MATFVGVCSRGTSFVCGDMTGSSTGGGPNDADGISVTWISCDEDRQMGEVATSTFTTSDAASVAAVVDLIVEDGV
jgi:hypothetical protein